MKYGLMSGLLWALDTTILSIALAMSPYGSGLADAIAFAAIVSSAFHDMLCGVWMTVYMGVKGRLRQALVAVKTRSGMVVAIGALLGGPVGMTGYVMAINLIGPAYTAIVSAFYPAFGTILSAVVLKEKVTAPRVIALFAAMLGIAGMSFATIGSSELSNPVLGIACALLCVVGWGSEAVFCAWGMRDDAVDNESALFIREVTSGLSYGILVLPLFGAWSFGVKALPTPATSVIAVAAIAGVASYLFYYKGIGVIGAARGMALNISYSAWAVLFGVVLLGATPSAWEVVCCVVILVGTVLSATDWNELRGRVA